MKNTPKKEELQTVVEKAQRTCCVYDSYGKGSTTKHNNRKPPSMCDCKFGGQNVGTSAGEDGNGCPELRVVAALLKAMTPQEYEKITKRAIRKNKVSSVRDWVLK